MSQMAGLLSSPRSGLMTDNDDYRDSDVLARRQQAPNRTPSVPQIWWKVGCAPRQPTPSTRTTRRFYAEPSM